MANLVGLSRSQRIRFGDAKTGCLISWCGLGMTPKIPLLRSDLVGVRPQCGKRPRFEISSNQPEKAGSVRARTEDR